MIRYRVTDSMRTTFRKQSHSSNVQHFINASIYSHVRILDVNDLGPWSPSADVDSIF